MPEALTYSIVIPCYNESGNLRAMLQIFSDFIGKYPAELILVDNGSTDETPRMKDELCGSYPFVRWVSVAKNRGYGHGIFTGIGEAKGKYICYTHADLQTDPVDVERAILLQQQSSDANILIKGQRKGRKWIDRFFSRGLEIVVAAILGVKLREINAQPNLFPATLVTHLKNPPDHWGFDLYLYYIAKKHKQTEIRIDVLFPDRKTGMSKWKTGNAPRLRFSANLLKYCFILRKSSSNKRKT